MNLSKEEKDVILKMRKRKKEDETFIGKWVFITGSSMIAPDYWKKSFPQGIFGRVILRQGVYFIVRVYGGYDNRHMKATAKYLQIIEKLNQ